MENKKALIVVDYQNDFVNPKIGTLYVKDAEKIHSKLIKKIKEFKKQENIIVASKDFHPIDHTSFKIWPQHCIKDKKGSELYKINEKLFDKIILKGQNKDKESYSAFYDEVGNSNGLDEYLKKEKINEVVICGVALDVCVSATMVDAIKLGYKGSLDLELVAYIKNKIVF